MRIKYHVRDEGQFILVFYFGKMYRVNLVGPKFPLKLKVYPKVCHESLS